MDMLPIAQSVKICPIPLPVDISPEASVKPIYDDAARRIATVSEKFNRLAETSLPQK